jgi:hypothetical protein
MNFKTQEQILFEIAVMPNTKFYAKWKPVRAQWKLEANIQEEMLVIAHNVTKCKTILPM